MANLFGTAGNDDIVGTLESDIIYGGEGKNTLRGDSGLSPFPIGSSDIIYGGSQEDEIFGVGGDDLLFGGEGVNTIFGGTGKDLIYGGSGNDSLYGGLNSDIIYAGEGNNTVYGDTPFGDFPENGDDVIFTGSGNDTIAGVTGNNTIWLGGGQDVVVLQSGFGADTINNFQLSSTKLDVSFDPASLTFTNTAKGAEISLESDILAVVSWQNASVFTDNQSSIFI